ncbi:hypothetical protein GLYMA_08G034500v4 [Glycine max]|uniref:Uncharacterized protein n=4 Tax=Glycine subgen. Soja TaxID=1462606 RepID=I1KPX7_SOYBN|nr:uncharacterized protein LOC102663620 [Glycine max]XP_028245088.1 uncharacterized protein LOC114422766 [Glycine soja]KAG5014670.1 hypothetical protein JHK85_020806 [Glycine max]KAH1049453.1 hypothetical protein GYH30_020125 [Glycine max]KHN16634.1 hypothetical protein glysoja_002731 [Glycine soja]KRH41511.1 hypothetical protein GLYMA_08G034500v4 [Glycine max]RZB95065.1 hypothetical protein D0Y65_019501 [Glycine soja]|eukprot:XP_006584813.1 uncharacterized protein LOC102663620 [Glycine max]
MEYQSFGRVQRPKGANIMQALKVILVLAVGAWLLYQVKHSRNDTENYSDQTEFDGAILLGRKGMPSRLDEMDFPDSGNVDSAGEANESSNGRDDGSGGAKEDKAEEEFGHIYEIFSRGKEVELEPESTQPELSSKIQHKHLSKTKSEKVGLESRSESGHKEHGNEKYPRIPIINDSKSNDKEEEVQLREQLKEVQVRKNATSDFSKMENDGDEWPKIREKETRMHKNVADNDKNAEVTEEINEVQSFHDENGVPPNVNETEIVHEENISNAGKGSWFRKHIYEVTYVEDNTVEVNWEASKNHADEEINTVSITQVDPSGIKRNSEIDGDS